MKDSQRPTSVVSDHRRQWRSCRYVYPVISRRSRGVSIGVNLNLDKRCTFSCRYCQINRRLHRLDLDVDIGRLREELDEALTAAIGGELWTDPRFAETPPPLRRINDIAFSGDGEPTCLEHFDVAVSAAVDALGDHQLLDTVKLVLITNATRLSSPQMHRALPMFDRALSEIWAKLDAGTEEFFRRVNRPTMEISLDDIQEQILSVAKDRPVVIQTLWFAQGRDEPPQSEIDAYGQRLKEILSDGGQIQRIQLHTIARPPSEDDSQPLPDARLDEIAAQLRAELTTVPVEVFYGRA